MSHEKARRTGNRKTLCVYVELGVLLAVAFFGRPAFARETKSYPPCTHEPTESDVAAAKGAFQAGQAAFNEADYDRAITYWEDAFRRDCTATPLLLNLARAYELNENKPQAVVALETYVAKQPDSEERDQITRRIEVLNRQIEEEEQKATAARAAAPPPAPPQATPGPAPPASITAEADESESTRPIYPLFIAGGGLALGVVGGLMWNAAGSDIETYEAACGGSRECRDDAVVNVDGEQLTGAEVIKRGNDARFRRDVGGALAISGAAITVGGVVWYLLQTDEPQIHDDAETGRISPRSRSSARLVPVYSPTLQGLLLTGRF